MSNEEVDDITQKILAIAGRKQSGKTTTSNFIHALALTSLKLTPKAYIHPETGELIVETEEGQERGFNTKERHQDFVEYAAEYIWPFIQAFSFADVLKDICVNVFGLRPEQVYGDNGQKDTLTPFLWEDCPRPQREDWVDRSGFITARQFLQYFSTDVCRGIYPNVWADSTIRRIQQSITGLAVIDDCRFPNEVEAVKDAGGKVIYLLRKVDNDSHPSESSLDPEIYKHSNFDKVIDNRELNIEQTNEKIFEVLVEWGWVVRDEG